MKNAFPYALAAVLLLLSSSGAYAQKKTIAQKVDSVLRLMTLEEKIGQMNQYNGDWEATGPITKEGDKQNQIQKGMVGSMLNVTGVEHTRELQEIAMSSRLKIPLLFGQDIIHGYRTTFPIPLAEAASWDLPAIQNAAHVAACEAAAAGDPAAAGALATALLIAETIHTMPFEVNIWQAQNIWNDLLRRSDTNYWPHEWKEEFKKLGRTMNISVDQLVIEEGVSAF